MEYKPFSVAWWHQQSLGAFRLSSPHWHSGLSVDKRADGAIGMVARVMATSEEQARSAVSCAYDRYQSNLEFRPCATS